MFSISAIATARSSLTSLMTAGMLIETGELRRAPATLAGDDFVSANGSMTQHDRLHHALRFDRRGQFGDALVANVAARLILARMNLIDRDLGEVGARRRGDLLVLLAICRAQQRVESATQTSLLDHAAPSPPELWRFNSPASAMYATAPRDCRS